MTASVESCMSELKPMCDLVNRLLATAPLDANGRAGLAVAVATYFFASACAALRMANQGGPTELSEILLSLSFEGPRADSSVH